MLRVLMLDQRLSARGGADRYLLALLDRLQGRVETLVAVGWDDGSLPENERGRLGPWRRIKGLERSGLSARGGRAARERLRGLLEEFRPHIIHLHNVMDPDLLELAAGSAPALMTVQDHRLFCPGLGKLTPAGRICRQVLGIHCLGCFQDQDYGRRLLMLTRRRLAAAAGLGRVTVLSSYMARELKQAWARLGREGPPVVVLPPFVHGLEAVSHRGAGSYHLLACRLVERKGVRVALAAAEGGGLSLPLVVAGDGTLAGEVRARARSSGGRIGFAGWAHRRDMARLLAGARSLWLPSLWAEPFGIAGLEALALGVPVIASRVGGVSDWLEPGGLGVAPGSVDELVGAARSLEQEPERAMEMGRAGREQVTRRFAPGPLLSRLIDIYHAMHHAE